VSITAGTPSSYYGLRVKTLTLCSTSQLGPLQENSRREKVAQAAKSIRLANRARDHRGLQRSLRLL
jgi:hypothetical protein